MKRIKHFSSCFLALALGALPALAACDDDDAGDDPAGAAGNAQGGAGTGGGTTAGSGGGAGSAGNGAGGSAGNAGAGGTGGGAGSGAFFEVDGKTGGAPVPDSAQLVVLWSVYTEGPDFLFKFGDGTSTGSTFVAELGADPPAGAINSNGLGMGYVFAFKPGYTVPEGKTALNKDELSANVIGMTTRHLIVWRDPSKAGLPWSGAFPAGYACGRSVQATEPDADDTYVEVDCSEVELTFTDDFDSLD
ncbi:MAG TPA: hypothetical protein VFS00_32395 [Polyangiaceae bacterium]|nr:hypothetical protein [Polyangiaceae bacterium]